MNKKNISIILITTLLIISIFTITGCSNKESIKNNNHSKETKSVVLYFSATGNTQKIAKKIASLSNSDIIEIISKEKYKKEDLDYNKDCRANREQNDSKARPDIKNTIDISKYDTIYLGYPIWWGTNPKIILTLLDEYDFSDKIIIPFCTSGSTDITTSVNDLKKYYPNLNIKDGKRFSGNENDKSIKDFIDTNSSEEPSTMKAIIDNNEYIIELEDNTTAKSFVKMLPQELTMKELNGNEKYIYLDKSLPEKSYNPKRIKSGDLMLFGDNCLVLFYKSFETSYNYTKIGHINNLPDLGKDNITIRFEK